MSKINDAAERGKGLVEAYFGYADSHVDVVMMLADLDAWLARTHRLDVSNLAKYAHQIHEGRILDDEVWSRK